MIRTAGRRADRRAGRSATHLLRAGGVEAPSPPFPDIPRKNDREKKGKKIQMKGRRVKSIRRTVPPVGRALSLEIKILGHRVKSS